MYQTEYVRADSTADAMAKLAAAEDGKLLAGGMTLIPTLKQRLAAPDLLVDLVACGLVGISDDGASLRIGAMTPHVAVETDNLVRQGIPALASLAGHIGDRQVRNFGTLGGSVANNDPSACYPAAVLGLGAIVETTSRSIPAGDYFVDLFETALEEDEIITAISFPKPLKAAYLKCPNPASRYAMVGVFVACFADGVRVAITGAGEAGVFRHQPLEAALDAEFSVSAIDQVNIDSSGLMQDIHASADYRAHLIRVMTCRAVAALV